MVFNFFFFFTITQSEQTGHKLAVIASDMHNWPAQSNLDVGQVISVSVSWLRAPFSTL